MCTVIGYIGKSFCSTFIFEGLARLEYRGYDSAGFACLDNNSGKLLYLKSSGQLFNLAEKVKKNPFDGFSGIGHTRWSTHGNSSLENAHPHVDCSQTISVVHNGIIENHLALKKYLQQEHVFYSETDTEVISHLFESVLKKNSLSATDIAPLIQQLHGAYAFIVMIQKFPDVLIVVRKKSPLCIGLGAGEMFVASDVIAFADKTQRILFLPDESFALVFRDAVQLYDFQGNAIVLQEQVIDAYAASVDKGEYEHFMLKEIYEQKDAIIKTVRSLQLQQANILLDQLDVSKSFMRIIERVYFIACGTSWHAARIAQFFFESIVHIPVTVYLASELKYMSFFLDTHALYIFISQSGETADTLEALRFINSYGLRTIAVTNVATSTIVREAHGFLLTHAGTEVAVASTKAFTTQLATLYWLANYSAFERGILSSEDMLKAEADLYDVADILERTIEQHKSAIDNICTMRYAQYDKALFLGRHISYPLAMEAALKLKEIAYVFAESYAAGELKHGPLALVDTAMPVYIFSHRDPIIYQKLLSNAHEVKARGGIIIAFAYQDQHELCVLAETVFTIADDVPALLGPLAMIGVVQYFVYAIAKERGCPVDKPRNLAKSVTVE